MPSFLKGGQQGNFYLECDNYSIEVKNVTFNILDYKEYTEITQPLDIAKLVANSSFNSATLVADSSFKSTIIMAFAVILSALISGVFVWLSSKNTKKIEELIEKIDELIKKILKNSLTFFLVYPNTDSYTIFFSSENTNPILSFCFPFP